MSKKILIFCIITCIILTFHSFNLIAQTPDKIKVFVSILPQQYFVDRIGGSLVDSFVMVGPGQNPHTFEPTPKKMAELSEAQIYFRIGISFENIWIDRIQSANPKLKIIDTRKDIKLRAMEGHHHHEEQGEHDEHEEGNLDPHIWMSPTLVKIQAETICNALSEIAPTQKDVFKTNLDTFKRDLDKTIVDITVILKPLKKRSIMLFHPSLGYFCDEFNLVQIPIEVEGKEPSAKSLSEIIDKAKENGIKTIFVQQQFSKVTAERIAESVGAKLVYFDHLAYDYINNIKEIANSIYKACSE
jgi:zinc transport system substrate-binding protein